MSWGECLPSKACVSPGIHAGFSFLLSPCRLWGTYLGHPSLVHIPLYSQPSQFTLIDPFNNVWLTTYTFYRLFGRKIAYLHISSFMIEVCLLSVNLGLRKFRSRILCTFTNIFTSSCCSISIISTFLSPVNTLCVLSSFYFITQDIYIYMVCKWKKTCNSCLSQSGWLHLIWFLKLHLSSMKWHNFIPYARIKTHYVFMPHLLYLFCIWWMARLILSLAMKIVLHWLGMC